MKATKKTIAERASDLMSRSLFYSDRNILGYRGYLERDDTVLISIAIKALMRDYPIKSIKYDVQKSLTGFDIRPRWSLRIQLEPTPYVEYKE